MSANENSKAIAAPVSQSERIVILDSLRGIAILGILLMNIPGFGLARLLATDPSVLGETGLNYNVWYFIDLIPEGTQRSLFSMLFGAGIILFISRQEKKLDGIKPAEYYFRRQLWLLVFGLIHGFLLLWYWDILFHYAIGGMILFAFYRLSPKALIVCSIISLLLMVAVHQRFLYKEKRIISRGETVAAIDTTKVKLTDKQKADLSAMEGFKEEASIESKIKAMKKENEAVLGSYSQLYENRTDKTIRQQKRFGYYAIWDILMFMFLGMAFYKNGVLLAKAKTSTYLLFFLFGFGIGVPISYSWLHSFIDNGFNEFDFVKNTALDLYETSRYFRAIGFLGLVMLLYKSGWFKWLFELMRPVGQMAFTNYLLQSIIGGIYFYGIGFGMFSKLQRYELYFYVAAVWIFEIILSHVWLRYFRFGPFEWLWRSLTYWKIQPIKKQKKVGNLDVAIA